MRKTTRVAMALLLALMLVMNMVPMAALAAETPEPTAAELEEQQLTEEALAEVSEILELEATELEEMEEVPIPKDDPGDQESFAKAVTAVSKYIKLSATELELKAGETYDIKVVPQKLAKMFHWQIGKVKNEDESKEYLAVQKIDQETLTIKFRGKKTGGKVGFKVNMEDKALNDLVKKNPDLQKYVDEIEENFKESMSCKVATNNTGTKVIAGVGIPKDPVQDGPIVPTGGNGNGETPAPKPSGETPKPKPTEGPTPSIEPDKSPDPVPTEEPTPSEEPSPSPDPSEEPGTSPEPDGPSASPDPSEEPSASPSPTPTPSLAPPLPPPTVKPTQTPPVDPNAHTCQYSEITDMCTICGELNPDHVHGYPSDTDRCKCGKLNPDHSHQLDANGECRCGYRHAHTHGYNPADGTGKCIVVEGCTVMCDHGGEMGPTVEKCLICGVINENYHVHRYDPATDKCECGELDPEHQHQYNPETGKCKCGELEPEHQHEYDPETDRCKCGALKPGHVHLYDDDGRCKCGETHSHHFDKAKADGVCAEEGCSKVCDHGGEMPRKVPSCPICGVVNENYYNCAEKGHIWKDGACEVCGETHDCAVDGHVWKDKVCEVCQSLYDCTQYGHKWKDGVCEMCETSCTHLRLNAEGNCAECGLAQEHDENHHWWNPETGKCVYTACVVICVHTDVEIGQICLICGMVKPEFDCAAGRHEWNAETGGCKHCEAVCEHPNTEVGQKCEVCQMVKPRPHDENDHWWNANTGTCDYPGCDAVCQHEGVAVNEKCDVCQMIKPVRLHDEHHYQYKEDGTFTCTEEGCTSRCPHDGMNANLEQCPQCGMPVTVYIVLIHGENAVHEWLDGVCATTGCGLVCEHPDTLAGAKCEICHSVKPVEPHETHVYKYDAEKHESRCIVEGCTATCQHTGITANDKECPGCQMPNSKYLDPDHKCTDWDPETGRCTESNCQKECPHEGMIEGNLPKCLQCQMVNHAHVHDCSAGNGICAVDGCDELCAHAFGSDGICSKCEKPCDHGMGTITNGIKHCSLCGMDVPVDSDGTVEHDHNWRQGYSVCSVEGCTEKCPHTGVNGQDTCPTCGAINPADRVHVHVDENKDGYCDDENCKQEMPISGTSGGGENETPAQQPNTDDTTEPADKKDDDTDDDTAPNPPTTRGGGGPEPEGGVSELPGFGESEEEI